MKKNRKLFIIMNICLLLFAFSINVFGADNKALNIRLKNLDGKTINIIDMNRDKVLIISFWATWCGPCKKELPHLNKLHEKYYEKGVNVLCVNQDNQRSLSKVKFFMKSKKYKFDVVLDPDESFFKRFNARGIPYLIVFDREGNKIYNHLGYMPGDEKELEKEIKKLFAEKEEQEN